MSDAFGKLIGRGKPLKSRKRKRKQNSGTAPSTTPQHSVNLVEKKPKLRHDAPMLHPREIRRAIAARKRPAPQAQVKVPMQSQRVHMVAKVKSLQEICAKRLSKCMERFQHETFRLDSKTFAAVLRMAGSRLTEPVLTALSIANPSMAEELDDSWKSLYKQRYGSPSGLAYAKEKREAGATWHEVFVKFAKRRRKELKRAKKHAKKKIKAAKKSNPHRKTKKVRVVPIDSPPPPYMRTSANALTPGKVSSSRATTVFDSPSILEKLRYRRQGVGGQDKSKMSQLKAQCLQLKATKRK